MRRVPGPTFPRPPCPSVRRGSVTPPAITSAKLDQLIEQYLSKLTPKVEPAPLTSDIEFVRRIHFDLAGAPPTPQQVLAFVSDRSKDKRAGWLMFCSRAPNMPATGPDTGAT